MSPGDFSSMCSTVTAHIVRGRNMTLNTGLPNLTIRPFWHTYFAEKSTPRKDARSDQEAVTWNWHCLYVVQADGSGRTFVRAWSRSRGSTPGKSREIPRRAFRCKFNVIQA